MAVVLCECAAREDGNAPGTTSKGATAFHGGNPDGCTRPAAVCEGVVTSPALCTPCLFGCYE